MGTVTRPSLELATMTYTNSGWLRSTIPTRSPARSPARRSSQASWLPRTTRSRLRTGSTGSSPFSKIRARRSGSSSARRAISLAKIAVSCSRSTAGPSGDQDVDGAGGGVGAHPAASVLGQGHLRVRHLALPAAPLQLPGELDHLGGAGRADGVAAGQQASARVHREPAAQPGDPVQDQARRLPLLAQAELLVELQLRDRGGVVELDHVQVLGTHPGALVGCAHRP